MPDDDAPPAPLHLLRAAAGVAGRHPPMRLTGEALASERGGRLVFSGVSFEVAGGSLLAVVGPNGAGKSTLLRIIAGLLPAASGSLTLTPAGDGPRGVAMHYLGHRDAVKPPLSPRENLAFWRRVCAGEPGLSPAEAMEAVGLPQLLDLPAGVLSAGQRRRVAIARLLAVRRPVWLLDEPTAALDAAAEQNLARLVEAHLAGGGLVVAATHQPMPIAAAATLRLGGAP